MDDLWTALGLVLVIEGAIYALFPQAMIDMMRRLPDIPPRSVRLAGIIAVAIGWMVVRFIRN